MDRQNRAGSKPGSGGVAGWSESNVDRRERLRKLAAETIDLSKDPYILKNHLGSFECKLCLTLHTNEGSYLAHTQGKKHQANLARRAARETRESNLNPAVPSVSVARTTIPKRQFVKIGRPGYYVTKIRDESTRQVGFLFKVLYPQIAPELKPRHRFMSAYEQKVEPANKEYQYVVIAAEPYETIAFRIPSREIDLGEVDTGQWDQVAKSLAEYMRSTSVQIKMDSGAQYQSPFIREEKETEMEYIDLTLRSFSIKGIVPVSVQIFLYQDQKITSLWRMESERPLRIPGSLLRGNVMAILRIDKMLGSEHTVWGYSGFPLQFNSKVILKRACAGKLDVGLFFNAAVSIKNESATITLSRGVDATFEFTMSYTKLAPNVTILNTQSLFAHGEFNTDVLLHNLYIYPLRLVQKQKRKYRNIQCTVEVCDESSRDPINLIYGTQYKSAITYHCGIPEFVDEIPVKLPPTGQKVFIKFKFTHLGIRKQASRILGYSYFRLHELDKLMGDGTYSVPLVNEIPETFVNFRNEISSEKEHFTFSLKFVSDFIVQDPFMCHFFRGLKPRYLESANDSQVVRYFPAILHLFLENSRDMTKKDVMENFKGLLRTLLLTNMANENLMLRFLQNNFGFPNAHEIILECWCAFLMEEDMDSATYTVVWFLLGCISKSVICAKILKKRQVELIKVLFSNLSTQVQVMYPKNQISIQLNEYLAVFLADVMCVMPERDVMDLVSMHIETQTPKIVLEFVHVLVRNSEFNLNLVYQVVRYLSDSYDTQLLCAKVLKDIVFLHKLNKEVCLFLMDTIMKNLLESKQIESTKVSRTLLCAFFMLVKLNHVELFVQKHSFESWIRVLEYCIREQTTDSSSDLLKVWCLVLEQAPKEMMHKMFPLNLKLLDFNLGDMCCKALDSLIYIISNTKFSVLEIYLETALQRLFKLDCLLNVAMVLNALFVCSISTSNFSKFKKCLLVVSSNLKNDQQIVIELFTMVEKQALKHKEMVQSCCKLLILCAKSCLQFKESHDFATKIDCLQTISECYFGAPELRLATLEQMAQMHEDRRYFDEAGMCYLHCAALVSEFLSREQGTIKGAHSFLGCSKNISREQCLEATALECQASPEDLMEVYFERCVRLFLSAKNHALVNEAYKVIFPLWEQRKEYTKLCDAHAVLSRTFKDMSHDQGEYYLCIFHRTKLRFVYKERFKIQVFIDRLKKEFPNVCIVSSIEILDSELDPQQDYIQVLKVVPYNQMNQSVDSFELKDTDLDHFIYFMPVNQSKFLLHSCVCKVEDSFCFIKNRIKVTDTQTEILKEHIACSQILKQRSETLKSCKSPRSLPRFLHSFLRQSFIDDVVKIQEFDQEFYDALNMFILDCKEALDIAGMNMDSRIHNLQLLLESITEKQPVEHLQVRKNLRQIIKSQSQEMLLFGEI